MSEPVDRTDHGDRARTQKAPGSVCVVGPGTRFLSGISVHTIRLADALAVRRRTSMLTMRQLLPTRFYPGRGRVGEQLGDLKPTEQVDVMDGVDWYWFPSMLRALAFLVRRRPTFIILQWWTATVLHSYLAIVLVGRLLGSRVIVEFHEVLDVGEAKMKPVRAYVAFAAPILLRLVAAYAVHSQFDRELLEQRYKLGRRPVAMVPLGHFDHYQRVSPEQQLTSLREAPPHACNVLFFGVIRPYKGLEDLVAAFDSIPPDEIDGYWLTVVGETWEGWDQPAAMIEASRYRDRITFVNRYVHDRELDAFLRGADAVVLPYRRSSLSGPLHVAMGYGLPVVISDVGGNAEAAAGYEGVVLSPPSDPVALRRALARVAALRDKRFGHGGTWDLTAQAYETLFERLAAR